MKGNNLFGNSKTNKTSGNFISNKKDKTIYTNIINNDFQNIENTSFKSSQDLKNDSIFLKSIGGFNVSSQSARIDLARGRSLSESFNYKNKVIKEINQT